MCIEYQPWTSHCAKNSDNSEVYYTKSLPSQSSHFNGGGIELEFENYHPGIGRVV